MKIHRIQKIINRIIELRNKIQIEEKEIKKLTKRIKLRVS